MPSTCMRSLGIAAVAAALAGCSSPSGAGPTPSAAAPPSVLPSATSTGGGWIESLDFSGDFSGHMALVAPPAPNQSSECTGKNSRTAGVWASTLFGSVGSETVGVIVLTPGYHGPGSYDQSLANVQVTSLDHARVWASQAGDQLTFTVAADEESGTLDASLTNLANGRKLKVTGRWSCKT